jgi:hypothetical protein
MVLGCDASIAGDGNRSLWSNLPARITKRNIVAGRPHP